MACTYKNLGDGTLQVIETQDVVKASYRYENLISEINCVQESIDKFEANKAIELQNFKDRLANLLIIKGQF